MSQEEVSRRTLRTPRAAAVAGIIFSLLLTTSLVLVRLALPAGSHQTGRWLTDPNLRRMVRIALNLVPFAGIAFLWFIGVVRDRIGVHEDRFFATVFLGSGLLFVAMLFVTAAVAGGAVAGTIAGAGSLPGGDVLALVRTVISGLMNVYAMRMAAVFMFATATIALRTAMLPRWIGYLGYAVGVVLLLGVGIVRWVELLFPIWVLLLSLDLLVASLRAGRQPAG